HRVDRLTHHLDLTSRSEKKRTLLFGLKTNGYRVVAGAEEDVRSPGQPRYARLTLEPKAKRAIDVVEEGAVVERIAMEHLSTQRLDALLAQKVDAGVRTTLVSIRTEVARAEAAAERVRKLEGRIAQIEADTARLRDNLAAAGKGGATKVAEELGQKLLAAEEELVKVRGEREEALKSISLARSAALQAVAMR
ncbi:MAG: hypothetical protein JNK82_31455, partial [Myxococcaceae bacterium]|nr:hypothetical protein [Myxococcaceae bacterium]